MSTSPKSADTPTMQLGKGQAENIPSDQVGESSLNLEPEAPQTEDKKSDEQKSEETVTKDESGAESGFEISHMREALKKAFSKRVDNLTKAELEAEPYYKLLLLEGFDSSGDKLAHSSKDNIPGATEEAEEQGRKRKGSDTETMEAEAQRKRKTFAGTRTRATEKSDSKDEEMSGTSAASHMDEPSEESAEP